ncbi:IS1 family transposase [Candidatus Bandiella euplotis]|uniref:IS1 family transposase n=1 Tax=Candidatus Bandiella euplotis TaxID=1664265 RepID=A0ABZ0UPL3_9RICK|nr:IS1 family transposase [Candidatus Bandiella woodruffii]WPX97068.1 IS1 family transposase [Candidatus Bandiella woodruffii]
MSYIHTSKKENKTRIWTAVDRDRFKTVAFKVGSGDKENYVDLARELGEKYQIRYMCTDGYEVYCHYKIAQIHLQTKSETCLVESFNSSLRDMLARLNRKTKRFSKCSEMLRLSLVLFFNKALALSIYL